MSHESWVMGHEQNRDYFISSLITHHSVLTESETQRCPEVNPR